MALDLRGVPSTLSAIVSDSLVAVDLRGVPCTPIKYKHKVLAAVVSTVRILLWFPDLYNSVHQAFLLTAHYQSIKFLGAFGYTDILLHLILPGTRAGEEIRCKALAFVGKLCSTAAFAAVYTSFSEGDASY